MKITNVEVGTIVVVALAIIAGAVQFGRLQGQIDGLDPEAISQAQHKALGQIDEAKNSSIKELKEQFAGQLEASWLDMTDERTGACVDDGFGRQHCQAINDLAYPILVAIETVNKTRPAAADSRGCGVAVRLVNGTPDWHTPRPKDDAPDLSLAHMVTGDQWGVCWATATITPGSSYYVLNAYMPDVEIVSWAELR